MTPVPSPALPKYSNLMHHKTIIILTLAQTLVIFLANVALGMTLKLYGYPDKNELVRHWNALPIALREHGHWFLLLPIVWAAFASFANQSGRTTIWGRLSLAMCIAVFLIPVVLTVCAIRNPYVMRHWFVFHHQPPSPPALTLASISPRCRHYG